MTDNKPTTTDFLSPNGYRLTIDKLDGVSYFSQEAPLPEVSLTPANLSTPHRTQIPFSGTDVAFSPLTINFLIDEELANYKEAFNWMMGLGAPEGYDQYGKFLQEQRTLGADSRLQLEHSDGTLIILSAHNTTISEIRFVDLTPVSLTGLPMLSTSTDVEYVQASLTLEYSYFYFEK